MSVTKGVLSVQDLSADVLGFVIALVHARLHKLRQHKKPLTEYIERLEYFIAKVEEGCDRVTTNREQN